MKYRNGATRGFPRLTVERSKDTPDEHIGFIEVGASDPRVEIGNIESREFRLLQCLFSPKNFLSAKYEPVTQTHERLFGAMQTSGDSYNRRSVINEHAEIEMGAMVEKSLRSLRRGKAGEYFAFVSEGDRVRMEIAPAKATT